MNQKSRRSPEQIARLTLVGLVLTIVLGSCEAQQGGGDTPPRPTVANTKEQASGSPVSLSAPITGKVGSEAGVLHSAEVYKGTKPSPKLKTRAGTSFSIAETGDVTLNFVNADIHEVIDTVLGDILGVPYVIDPRVSGTVTIRSTKPIRQDALVPTLENLLAVNGAALVASNAGYKVVPAEAASTSLPPAQVGAAEGNAFGV